MCQANWGITAFTALDNEQLYWGLYWDTLIAFFLSYTSISASSNVNCVIINCYYHNIKFCLGLFWRNWEYFPFFVGWWSNWQVQSVTFCICGVLTNLTFVREYTLLNCFELWHWIPILEQSTVNLAQLFKTSATLNNTPHLLLTTAGTSQALTSHAPLCQHK